MKFWNVAEIDQNRYRDGCHDAIHDDRNEGIATVYRADSKPVRQQLRVGLQSRCTQDFRESTGRNTLEAAVACALLWVTNN